MQRLFERVESIPLNPYISLRRYLYSVQQAYVHAKQYQREGNLEREALLLLRIATLVQKTISKHPDYVKVQNANIVKEFRLYAQLAIKRLEEIKPLIDAKENTSETLTIANAVQEESSQAVLQNNVHLENDLLSSAPAMKTRTMQVHEEMLFVFESIAQKNTKNNKETCGVLAGVLQNHLLVVTSLIVPKQTGMSDSCEMLNEEELFALQDKKNLMTLGWIHTHPQHPCFLSSVDVHTHASFQWILPEAIAIVIAPTDRQRIGIFSLTHPGGLEYTLQCQQRGHHPHPEHVPKGFIGEGKLFYENCNHVELVRDHSIRYEVYDLR
ncbi:STAM-binding protein isoform 1 [Galdieria sulphuraria]|uniref:STAM-binding protein isoform 1 n=1 Tax=Galdieria sulphuraria TaxID=130081 RepID=M2XMR8_GALSU|nr:STAM-binding protein isoform 1 [Galdieria sulphuraria]EME31482.1 STAM-binding protein isoform 1 [Galdieria sulphuraria]|eukprot:XP_005708002.1 STAM-binding protein isoform 1 [Galdieria sulphuraria]